MRWTTFAATPTPAEKGELGSEQYRPLSPDADGLLKSTVFPGLWLDAPALVRADLAGVLAVVADGARSAEHAEFVERLAAARSK